MPEGSTGWLFPDSTALPEKWPTGDGDYAKPITNGSPVFVDVAFNANGGEIYGRAQSFTWVAGVSLGTLPEAAYAGHTFDGWFTAIDGGTQVTMDTVVTGDVTYYAHWTAYPSESDPDPDAGQGTDTPPDSNPDAGQGTDTKPDSKPDAGQGTKPGTVTPTSEADSSATNPDSAVTPAGTDPVVKPVLWTEKVDGQSASLPANASLPAEASVYDGYLHDGSGNVKGTVQVKVAKPKNGTSKVTVNIVSADGKKKSLKGTLDVATGKVEGIDLTLDANRMKGTFDGYAADGSRSLFASKDKTEQGAAGAIAAKWSVVNVAWNGGALSVAIDKKGKAKVAGNLANGAKVSAKGQMIVGEEWLCVPVAWEKKSEKLAFTLWMRRVGGSALAVGLGDNVEVGAPASLKGGAAFRMDEAAFTARLGQSAMPYLPDGVSVAQSGDRWVVAGGAKAGKVQLGKDGKVDEAKLGANPSGLKLTYKAKDGSFKGSFKAYALVGGKAKATTVNVTGVMVGSVGYGTATIKGKGCVVMAIK